MQKQAQDKRIQDLCKYELGFSHVIEFLMKSKKPLVGHNMIYDIAFIYRQFLSPNYDLPKTFAEFANIWRASFP